MSILPDIELDTLRPGEIPPAAELAARGMRDNPMSIMLFGDDPVRRVPALTTMFHLVLLSFERSPVVARRRGVLTGMAAMAPPDRCFYRQMTAAPRTLQVGGRSLSVNVPRIPGRLLLPLLRLGPGAWNRMSAWAETGIVHDPPERHQHVELVVVEAALQGLGIGCLMMTELCRQMDELRDPAYLETDKPENVRFYERFGFGVTAEATTLGTRSWHMLRPGAR